MMKTLNRHFALKRRLLTVLVVASASVLVHRQTAASGGISTDKPSAFGPAIVDIALTLDDAAKQSLQAAPETGVRGQMIFKEKGEPDETYDVTIRIKGGEGSRRSLRSKPAFKIKLQKGDRFFGLEELTLNNMVQDMTMLHEAVGYQVYEAAGVAVPATGYARVSVNGEAYGLYLNQETIDAHFLKRRFGDDRGILYEGAYGVDLRVADAEKFQLHEGQDAERAHLKALIHALDARGDDVFYGTVPAVDTRSFLAMMAASILLDDWDNYYHSNNYRIYWNPSTSRWVFIPTGIDQTFGSNSIHVFGATGLLFQKCLASRRCTNDYAAAVRDVAALFEGLDLPARMDALLAVIDEASQNDPRKKYGAAKMKAARDAMRVFIARRPNEVRAALSCLDGEREFAIGGCAGVVLVNPARNQCLEAVPDAKRSPGRIRVAPCSGATKQRWRLTASSDAFELASVSLGACLDATGALDKDGAPLGRSSCAGAAGQLFSLRANMQDTQLVARNSGKCVAVAPGNPKDAAVVQVACARDDAQTWRVQRSIFP